MHIKNRVMETQIGDSDRQGLGLSLIISRIISILTFLHTTHYIFNKDIFTHLADAFIQSDLQCIQVIHFFVSTCVPWETNPQPLPC